MKLSQPIALNVVRAFRHVVDFYYWRGIPVARKWPVHRRLPISDAAAAQHQAMRDMHAWLKAAPASWHRQWLRSDPPVGRTAVDLERKTYLWFQAQNIHFRPISVTNVYRKYYADTDTTYVWIYYEPYNGFDPTVYYWKIDYFDQTVPAYGWIAWGYVSSREKYKCPNVVPDVSRYVAPATQTLSITRHCWKLTVPGYGMHISLLPFHKDTQ